MSIVGKYKAVKVFSEVNGNRGIFPVEEAIEDRQKNNGDIRDLMRIQSTLIEFTADGKVREWMKLPDGVSEEMLKAAMEAGEIEAAEDGYACRTKTVWKEENGKAFYDTGIQGTVLGEKQSSWAELTKEDGLLVYGSGLMRLQKM